MTAPAITRKPDASKVYVCIESHTSDTGTIREGERLRGDHPDVERVPVFYVVDGTSIDDTFAAQLARFRARE